MWGATGFKYGLVPDNTVHKGTRKRHKTDLKSTNFVVHVSTSLFYIKINKLFCYTRYPLKSTVVQFKKNQC